jgi:fatty acid desaturase
MPDTAAGEAPSVARQLSRLVDRAELASLSARRHGLALLGGHLAALIAGGAWVWAARGSWWLLPALAVHGMVMAHLFALLHEASHRTPFRAPALNDVVAHACGFVIILPAGYFRLEHVAHHQHTQDTGRDPELVTVPRSLAGYMALVAGLPYWGTWPAPRSPMPPGGSWPSSARSSRPTRSTPI